MLTYKEFRKKLLTELDQRGIKFEITSMTSVNGEKERISIAFSNFTTDNAVDSDHKPETFGLYPDHEYANYLGLCESESESPVERIVDDALQIMSQLSEKVSLEYVNSFLKLRDEDIIYQLINAKKNEELLKKVPHRIVADDLAVIYRIYKTEIDENSDEKLVTSTIILNSLMEESRYTEEKLYACASVNMPKQFPIFILNVQQSEIFSLLVNRFGYSLMDAKEKVLSMPLAELVKKGSVMLPFFIPCFFHHSTNRHKFADERSMKFIFCYVYYFISKENLYYGNNQSKINVYKRPDRLFHRSFIL